MRAVIQRVVRASVTVKGQVAGAIGRGMLVLLGISKNDTKEDADYLVKKILDLRIFDDAAGKMNYSLNEIEGDLLIVSQFTLYGDCRKGRRPSYTGAATPDTAHELYEYFVAAAKQLCIKNVETGSFRAMMQVSLINDGPVTLLLDSEKN